MEDTPNKEAGNDAIPQEEPAEGPVEAQKPEQPQVFADAAQQTEKSNAADATAQPQEELPAWMKVNKAWEGGDSYPIRMQLPKAAGDASPRTAEFAADSATITAAQDEHLLPKPSLDFEQFPGLAEEKTRLLSGTARRSLSGPIGVLIAVMLLMLASGIGAYRLGWLRWPGTKPAIKTEEPGVHPEQISGAKTTGDSAVAIPQPKAENKPVNAVHNVPAALNETLSNGAIAATSKSGERGSTGSKNAASPGAKTRGDTKPETKDPPVQVTNPDGVYVAPKLLKAIRSLSPPEALRAFASGVVTLDALVDENGKVLSATPTSGPKALYEKAAQTVREGYLYQPATRNGKPVQAHVDVKIQFWYEP